MPSFQFSEIKNRFPFFLKKYLQSIIPVLIFALLPLVMYWAYNLGQVRPMVVVDPLIIILISAFVLFHIFLVILRSLSKTTLMMYLLIFLFFSYGHIAQSIPLESSFTELHLLIIYILSFLVGTYFIFRAKHFSPSLFSFFQIVIVLLLVFNVAKILRFEPRIAKTAKAQPVTVKITSSPDNSPDIYYIILDAYAREDILQQVYGFDNTEFLAALRARGFYIPECGWSNYDQTHLTIPSVLNMDYLNNMGIPDETLTYYTAQQIDLILNNQVWNTFSSLNYKFVTTRGWGSFDDITNSDVYLNYYSSQGQEDKMAERHFIYLFVNTTLLHANSLLALPSKSNSVEVNTGSEDSPQMNTFLLYEEAEFWYHQNNYLFKSLEELPERGGGPYLVYAHINSPHGPYVFNQDGSFRFAPDMTNEKELYTDTLVFLNKRVLEMIDKIIANSDTPPVIILQSDHGTHYFINGINKHKILSAYYLPGEVSIKPYSTITPVNNFRLILHDYFDSSVELLPDTLIVMENGKYQAEPASCK